jgi:hypothetical protein
MIHMMQLRKVVKCSSEAHEHSVYWPQNPDYFILATPINVVTCMPSSLFFLRQIKFVSGPKEPNEK